MLLWESQWPDKAVHWLISWWLVFPLISSQQALWGKDGAKDVNHSKTQSQPSSKIVNNFSETYHVCSSPLVIPFPFSHSQDFLSRTFLEILSGVRVCQHQQYTSPEPFSLGNKKVLTQNKLLVVFTLMLSYE